MKQKLIPSILSLVLIAAFVLLPNSAFAQGLVPCTGVDCSFCHFVALGNNILNWLFGLVFVLFGVIAFVAGFGLVTSGGNQSKLDDAKKKLSNAFIGLIIVFAAWLMVDTLMKALVTDGNLSGVTGGEIGMWNEINCGVAGQRDPIATLLVGCTDNGDDTETCVTLAEAPLPGQACVGTPPVSAYDFECTYTRAIGSADDGSSEFIIEEDASAIEWYTNWINPLTGASGVRNFTGPRNDCLNDFGDFASTDPGIMGEGGIVCLRR